MGASGVVMFGLVGFLGLTDRSGSDPATTIVTNPAPDESRATPRLPPPPATASSSAVPLATIASGVMPTPAPPAPPTIATAAAPVDVVSEQSR
jgi:hypothetical protein